MHDLKKAVLYPKIEINFWIKNFMNWNFDEEAQGDPEMSAALRNNK